MTLCTLKFVKKLTGNQINCQLFEKNNYKSFFLLSALSAREIEELIEVELASVDTVCLNKFLPAETFLNEVLKDHVQSVICFCGTDVVS